MVTWAYIKIYCTGFDTITIPISSFRVQSESGVISFLQAVIPGMNFAEQIADRAGGNLAICFNQDGVEISIGEKAISSIRIDEGGKSQSITLQANN